MTDQQTTSFPKFTAMGSLEPSIEGSALEMLNALPAILNDAQFTWVRELANSPLVPPPLATDQNFSMAMKLLESCLPRRKDDTDTGELKFRAYRKCLSHLSKPQLFWTVEQAIKLQRFFPTVRELLDIAEGWVRCDDDVEAHRLARRIANSEANRRHLASLRKPAPPPPTQEQINAMDPAMQRMGLKTGFLIERDGRMILNPDPA